MWLKITQWLAQPFVLIFYSWAHSTVAFVDWFYITVPLLAALNGWYFYRLKRAGSRDYGRLVYFNTVVYLHFPLVWILWMTGYHLREGDAEFGLIAYALVFSLLTYLIWRRALRKKKSL